MSDPPLTLWQQPPVQQLREHPQMKMTIDEMNAWGDQQAATVRKERLAREAAELAAAEVAAEEARPPSDKRVEEIWEFLCPGGKKVVPVPTAPKLDHKALLTRYLKCEPLE